MQSRVSLGSVKSDVLNVMSLANSNGYTSEELQGMTGMAAAKLRRGLNALIADGKVEKTGKKRWTKYSLKQ